MELLRTLSVRLLGACFFALANFNSQTAAQRHQSAIDRFVAQNPAGREEYLSVRELDRLGKEELKSKGSFPKLVRGNPKEPTVALTFDDGPYADSTPKLLEILRKEGVHATMFNIGKKVLANPDLVKAEVAGGHEIANHTLNHVSLPKLHDYTLVDEELTFGADAIKKVLPDYKTPDICRPRGGAYNDDVIKSARAHKYTMALWTDNPGDYLGISTKELKRRLLAELSNGGIILLHDGVPNTLAVLPEVIQEVKRRGYRFVTCSEMLQEKGVITQGGPNTWDGK